ncbi:MAG: Gfo/Idh/MocA family oxidoreductase [Planctomycetaceae bacterium]
MSSNVNRRDLLTAGALAGAAWLAGSPTSPGTRDANSLSAAEEQAKSPNERWRIGCIGMRYQGSVITREATAFGDVIAIADVDQHVREQARASFGSTPKIYENYLDMLAKEKLDVVLIATPDHWHSKMLIDSVRAGFDVYCEKPLTLTIEEGGHIIKAVEESQRVVQVGTWQRSDSRFRQAVELVRAGRIGKLKRVTCVTDKNPTGGPFQSAPIPKHFNWNLWQGQTPDVPYIPERAHYTFRWWYEYSGGKMTDWGAHHLDIAQWAITGNELTGPVKIDGVATLPQVEQGYNVATDFMAKYTYANGVVLEAWDRPVDWCPGNGIHFEGETGWIIVSRGQITGKLEVPLKEQGLDVSEYQLYTDNLTLPERSGKIDAIKNHMANFYDCTHSRTQTISNVASQHRTVSTCHLGNISQRLGRPLEWDPVQERFVNDTEADGWLKREQRAGFEVKA